AYLLPGLTTRLIVEGKDEKSWKYERGMAQFFDFMLQGRELVAPLFAGEKHFDEKTLGNITEVERGEGAGWAIGWGADGATHAAKLLEMCVRDPFELWLNQHPDEGKKIVELAVEQALARLSKGKKVERKKSSGIATLPGKLVDCASGDVQRNELFLVEGDSAG